MVSSLLAIIKGAVTISPENSLACDGDQLELTCTITDPGSSLLEWTFAPATIFMGLHRAIDVNSPSDQTFMINSTLFTLSIISARGNLLLVSRLLIDPLTTDLNRTVVNCTDVLIMETASAFIHVLNRIKDGIFASGCNQKFVTVLNSRITSQ